MRADAATSALMGREYAGVPCVVCDEVSIHIGPVVRNFTETIGVGTWYWQ